MLSTVSLKKNRDFRRLYAKGRCKVGPLLAVYARKNGAGENRLGITVGTKVGCAVERNRVKRRIREAYRLSEKNGNIGIGYDIVVVARARAKSARFEKIEEGLKEALGGLGVWKED